VATKGKEREREKEAFPRRTVVMNKGKALLYSSKMLEKELLEEEGKTKCWAC